METTSSTGEYYDRSDDYQGYSRTYWRVRFTQADMTLAV